MFTYTALLQCKPCNYPPCRKRPHKSQFTYYFPIWMASRALIVSGLGRDLFGPGASWTVRVPSVFQSMEHDVAITARHGDLCALQKLLSQRRCSLYDVDEDGWTLLHVSAVSRRPLCRTIIPAFDVR